MTKLPPVFCYLSKTDEIRFYIAMLARFYARTNRVGVLGERISFFTHSLEKKLKKSIKHLIYIHIYI